MYKEFDDYSLLLQELYDDKSVSGICKDSRDRYPIRFVLFNNFSDARGFVADIQQKQGANVQSVSAWMDSNYEDTIITHQDLAAKITNFVASNFNKDGIISPFSELARFYNNEKFQFNSLISTIKAIESSTAALKNKHRVYVPIVGLSNKMSKFHNDSQIYIWYYKSGTEHSDCRLILTDGSTYGVKGLNDKYTVIKNVYQWLEIWKNNEVKQEILLTSPSLFVQAKNAQPDNSFSYTTCKNVYEFLIHGLKLSFPNITYQEKDKAHWEKLAKEIDVVRFDFDKFFNNYFHVSNVSDAKSFLRVWFECSNDFDKWLLSTYYCSKGIENDYICLALKNSCSLKDNDLFASILLTIFKESTPEKYFTQRLFCLEKAYDKSVTIASQHIDELERHLLSRRQDGGLQSVMPFISKFTDLEKTILLDWFREGFIQKDCVREIYPDLYHYLDDTIVTLGRPCAWACEYIDLYKISKTINLYKNGIKSLIHEKNRDEIAFNSWYQDFKSLKSLFNKRLDIDVYYWIDGLGIEWISYIHWLLKQKEKDGVYINETHIARASYPTTTAVNKPVLESLTSSSLYKKSYLDQMAHDCKFKLPYSIIDELKIVKKAVTEIVNEFAGKKIAIISDHGLTALSQLCAGLKLAGVESHHHGRIAVRTDAVRTQSRDYLYCDDGKTICALRHESLCKKVAKGQSVHGGCTPEEILIPVFIISPQKEQRSWSARLESNILSALNPILRCKIKGLQSGDVPSICYNSKRYNLKSVGGDVFESSKICLLDSVRVFDLYVGNNKQSFNIELNLGAVEEDLFSL